MIVCRLSIASTVLAKSLTFESQGNGPISGTQGYSKAWSAMPTYLFADVRKMASALRLRQSTSGDTILIISFDAVFCKINGSHGLPVCGRALRLL